MSKIVFITGVCGGIGQGLASGFQNAGYQVVGTDIHLKQPDHVNHYIPIDLNQYVADAKYRKNVEKAIDIFRKDIHVLINNAAVQLLDSFDNLKLMDWQESVAVNLTAPMLLSQFFLNGLEKNNGSIINIGSIHGVLTKPNFVSYATTKSALIGWTKVLAVDLRGRVRVNIINPAAIETEMLRAGFNNEEEAIDELRKLHPVERIGKAEDVARAALFLASESSGFIHGAELNLDGGIRSVLHDL